MFAVKRYYSHEWPACQKGMQIVNFATTKSYPQSFPLLLRYNNSSRLIAGRFQTSPYYPGGSLKPHVARLTRPPAEDQAALFEDVLLRGVGAHVETWRMKIKSSLAFEMSGG